MSEKLCVFCPHFDWEAIGYTYYSTLTGGDLEGGLSCAKGHFGGSFSPERPDSTDEFRKILLRAETCPDYGGPNK